MEVITILEELVKGIMDAAEKFLNDPKISTVWKHQSKVVQKLFRQVFWARC